jgi:hypothetical protein
MKSTILLASLFISCVFVSCKKEYTCSCKSSTGVEVKSDLIKNNNYDNAKKECITIQKDMNGQMLAADITCGLK